MVTGLTETLIRRKVLYPARLLGRYYLVAIDGTGVLVFTERHCAQCLTATHHGTTVYYPPVLEAKCRLGSQMSHADRLRLFVNDRVH